VRLVLGLEDLSRLDFGYDGEGRVLDIENVETHKREHRRKGYPRKLLLAVLALAPDDTILCAVGLHSADGLDWLAGMRRLGFQIHLNHYCFRTEDSCARDQLGGHCCVRWDERQALVGRP